MLDICTYIISFILFSDLVPDTWESCDMHYLDYITLLDIPCYFTLCSRVLMILWLCYTTVTFPGCLMFIIYMSHHACMILLYMIYLPDYSCDCYYIRFLIFPYILFLCLTYCYYIFIFSFIVPFLRVLLLVRFWRTFILFFSI